jgi:serine O-acetyltransferase
VRGVLDDVLDRMAHCVRHVRMKGWCDGSGPRFNHLHTDQYAVFLYYLSNTAHRKGIVILAAKAYALNKALHGLDAFYEVELPSIFAVVHPWARCSSAPAMAITSAAFRTERRRRFRRKPSQGVVMYGGARVIGKARIGDNCIMAAGCSIIGGEVSDKRIAFGHIQTTPPRRRVAMWCAMSSTTSETEAHSAVGKSRQRGGWRWPRSQGSRLGHR